MYLPNLELHPCETLEEASALRKRYGAEAHLLAGGTDLLVDLKTGRLSAGHLVSLQRIDTLRGVSLTNHSLRIGALTTITQLGRAPIVAQRFAPILDATREMAVPQVRNVATVGGNIVSAVPCADLPPILTVMNASVVLWSPAGERNPPLDAFFVGLRHTALRGDEVLTEIQVPAPPPGFGAAYARFALREGNAIAVAAVAASLLLDPAGTVRDARIALGAVAPTPKLVESARAVLIGQRPDGERFQEAAAKAAAAAEPICDVRGSADFRRELVGVLTRRGLATALVRAKEQTH